MKNTGLILSALICLSTQISEAQNTPSSNHSQSPASRNTSVHFADVIQLAKAYGTLSADLHFDARKDLNNDREINFQDFILFADQFGQSASMGILSAAASTNPNISTLPDAHIALSLQSSTTPGQATLTIALNRAHDVAAYCVALQYDATALQLMRAESAHPSQFAQHNSRLVSLQALDDAGRIILADAFAEPLPDDGKFLTLTFQITNPSAPTQIGVTQVLLADGQAQIHAVQGAHLNDLHIVPQTLTLRQNYPNPFNPVTEIAYELPDSGNVSLIIYNLLGQEIRRLINAPQNPGIYRISWDGTDAQGHPVSSGVYIYRITSHAHSQTRMMMLLK